MAKYGIILIVAAFFGMIYVYYLISVKKKIVYENSGFYNNYLIFIITNKHEYFDIIII